MEFIIALLIIIVALIFDAVGKREYKKIKEQVKIDYEREKREKHKL